MLYNPPSGQAGTTIALPDEREDYPQPAVPFAQSSVFTPPTDQESLPQVQQPQPQVQGQGQGQAQMPIDPSLLEIPPHPMAQQHQHMMHPAGPDYSFNGNPVADYGLQSAPMQSGNWQQNRQHANPNSNRTSTTFGNSPPDLSFSRSSLNASGTELVASPNQAYYNNVNSNSNGPAPVGIASSSRDPTLGGLNSTSKNTVSQQSLLNVDDNGAGPSGTIDDTDDMYDWANTNYSLSGEPQSNAGPSTYTGAYDESL